MPRDAAKPAHTIAVITGTRAEFGLLEPVLDAIAARPRLRYRLIATGMHLLPRFGRTLRDIEARGWRVDATVRMQSGRDRVDDEPIALARGVEGIARAVQRLGCDIVLVLGDRIEAFAGACAASLGRRVLAHIHGGDRAPGDVDDALRNAITRLAHVHFVASADARQRLLRMGEESGRIHQVGAPGLDRILSLRSTPAQDATVLESLLGMSQVPPYAVVVQHPAGRSADVEARTMRAVCRAVSGCRLHGVAIYPNSDPGHEGIIRVVEGLKGKYGWTVFRSLPREDYLRLVRRCEVLVGNSSSGIIESASLGARAVNVGRRQAGRLRCGPSVTDCAESADAVASTIRRAMRRPRPRGTSVYGNGTAGQRIAERLERLITTPRLLCKTLAW